MNPKVDRDASHVHKKDDSLLNNDNADDIQSRRICLNTNARSGLPIFKWDKELKKRQSATISNINNIKEASTI